MSRPLWNLGYNPVLRFLEKKLMQYFCYADDTLILLAADSVEELIVKIRKIIQETVKEMKELGLTLNRKKTAIMLLSKTRKYTGSTILQ